MLFKSAKGWGVGVSDKPWSLAAWRTAADKLNHNGSNDADRLCREHRVCLQSHQSY